MSHVTTGEMCITNLEDAEKAAKVLGGKLVRGQTTHKWYGRFLNDWHNDRSAILRGISAETFGTCEHAIVMEDATEQDYEIGLVRRSDGKGWDAIYDLYGPGARLEAKFGEGLCKLKTEFGVRATKRTYSELGYMVEERRNEQEKRQVMVWK